MVKQADYRVYPHNTTTIRNAWMNVESGMYNLGEFLRNVAYTPEQILRNEIGEPNFQHQVIPAFNMQPLNVLPHLILAPKSPPQPICQPIVLQPPAVLPIGPHLPVQPLQPLAPVQQPQIRPPFPVLHLEDALVADPYRWPRHIRGRARGIDKIGHPYPVDKNKINYLTKNRRHRQGRRMRRGRGQLQVGDRQGAPLRQGAAEAWAQFYDDLNNEPELEPPPELVQLPDQQPHRVQHT